MKYFKNIDEMSNQTALLIQKEAETAISEKGFFTLVLSGGNTPKPLFSVLSEDFSTSIQWNKVFIFWADERFLPAGDPEDNFYNANELLLKKIGIPSENIYRIITENITPEKSAGDYEKKIREFFASRKLHDISFDLILLGMGDDGHTASLFPGSPVLTEKKKMVRAVEPAKSAKPQVERITMTYPLLNAAQNVLFLISGKNKDEIAREIIAGNCDPVKIPASGIKPQGKLSWHVSQE